MVKRVFMIKDIYLVMQGEDNEFTSGTKRLIASVKGWKINLLVCYDLAISRLGKTASCRKMDLNMICLSMLPIGLKRRNHAWKTLLQARAIENQCYVVGINRVGYDGNNIYHSGDSMVVDPMG